MRLYAKCLPEYFAMLDEGTKTIEFRQIECITLENSETRETRTYAVEDVRKLFPGMANHIKARYSKVPWDAKLPVFVIELGEEIRIEPAHGGAASGVLEKRDEDEGKFEFFNKERKE